MLPPSKTIELVVPNPAVDGAKDDVSGTAPASSVKLMTQKGVKVNELSHKDADLIPRSPLSSMTREDVNGIKGAEAAANKMAKSIELATKKVGVVEKQNHVEEAVVAAGKTLPIDKPDIPIDEMRCIKEYTINFAKGLFREVDFPPDAKQLLRQNVKIKEVSHKDVAPILSSCSALVTQNVNCIGDVEDGMKTLEVVVVEPVEKKDADETLPIEDTDKSGKSETSV